MENKQKGSCAGIGLIGLVLICLVLGGAGFIFKSSVIEIYNEDIVPLVQNFVPDLLNQIELISDITDEQNSGDDVGNGGGETTGSTEADDSPNGSSDLVGRSRSNPAPIGSMVIVDDMEFLILSYIRPATDIVMNANEFNTEPAVGMEYIFVELEAKCTKPTDEQCFILAYNLKLVGSTGIERHMELIVADVDNLFEKAEIDGGTSETGYVLFILDVGEDDVIFIYESIFGGEIYLALD